ncbi:MAG: NAD(+) diphosphatase [Eubacteriales bacterium]|nr:NAD(+) diphosphatase [Eubacteriales bacterium]
MMLQDIRPHNLRNQYSDKTDPVPESPVYCFHRAKLLVAENHEDTTGEKIDPTGGHGKISMPVAGEAGEKDFYKEHGRYLRLPKVKELGEDRSYTFLFSLDGTAFFLLQEDLPEEEIPAGFVYKDIRKMRQKAYGPQHRLFAAITAYQLANWYRDNRYCGTCGTPTVHAENERAVCCPSCGRRIYPRIIPAVIVGVINGDRILLTKYAGTDFPFYALIAGFTEIGETFEETVRREVMEEAGIRVKNIRYYKSQPWGIVDDLLAGFYCDVDGDPTIHMDSTELKVAQWCTRDEIVLQPTDHSLTNEMMTRFKMGLEC